MWSRSSSSTEDYDRGTKLRHCRRLPSLREYVLVSQADVSIEIARRKGDLWGFDEVTGRAAVLHLEALGLDLPLAELYADDGRPA